MFGIFVSSKQICEAGLRPGKVLGCDQMHYQQTENVWSEIEDSKRGANYPNITKYLGINYANLFWHASGKMKGEFYTFLKEESLSIAKLPKNQLNTFDLVLWGLTLHFFWSSLLAFSKWRKHMCNLYPNALDNHLVTFSLK